MNTKIKILLICFIAGSISLGINSQVYGGPGDKVNTSRGFVNLDCRRSHGDLSFSGDEKGGVIKVQTRDGSFPGTMEGLDVSSKSGSSGNSVNIDFFAKINNLCVPGENHIKVVSTISGTCANLGEGGGILQVDESPGVFNNFHYHTSDVSCQDGGGPSGTSSCITGTEGNDNLVGTSKNDCINGGKGNDKISGLAGNDKLIGGEGNDILSGGKGNDELTGGLGADLFQCGSGIDKITDFNPAEGDKKTNDCEQFGGPGFGEPSGGFQ